MTLHPTRKNCELQKKKNNKIITQCLKTYWNILPPSAVAVHTLNHSSKYYSKCATNN
jgi:hypothetical protein